MRRCIWCKNGQVPDVMIVTAMTVFSIPKTAHVVLKCADCRSPLSFTSLKALNLRTVKAVVYE